MPSRDWRLRIQDILESIIEIEQRTSIFKLISVH
jgi:uncharacterized protein with HEPN domain